MKLAPICLFTYNRCSETQQTVKALQNNKLAKESDLFVFSDAAKDTGSPEKVKAVRDYLKSIAGFRSVTIFEATSNKGLANSIIDGVSQVVNEFGKVIVLEDDLITRPDFLNFMNQALSFYEDSKIIQSVNGYSLALKSATATGYFQKRPFPWGWATWKDRWDVQLFEKEPLKELLKADSQLLKQFKRLCGDDVSQMFLNSIHGVNDSWYVRWTFNHFKSGRFSVYPLHSFVSNIGFGEEGTHCKGINPYKSKKSSGLNDHFVFIDFKCPEKKLTQEFLRFFSKKHRLLVRVRLLSTSTGRAAVRDDIKSKIFSL